MIALVAALVVWLLLGRTTWGFRLGVVGGNPEAARRAGYPVALLLLGAIAVGGALAGLGGFVQLAGVEFKLRQGFLLGYGYIGFLASWLDPRDRTKNAWIAESSAPANAPATNPTQRLPVSAATA